MFSTLIVESHIGVAWITLIAVFARCSQVVRRQGLEVLLMYSRLRMAVLLRWLLGHEVVVVVIVLLRVRITPLTKAL